MNPYDMPGLVGGFAGTWLFLLGLVVAVGAAIRLLTVLRRPEQGRVARGLVAAGGVVGLAGVVLFWGAQATRHARAFDQAAVWIAVGSVVLGAIVGQRVGRRRGAAPPSPASSAPAP